MHCTKIFLLSISLTLSFTVKGQLPKSKQAVRNGDWAKAKIEALPEIKDFLRTTPKSYKPILRLEDKPNATSKYYWIKVGISNFDMFRTNFNFYIDPKTENIFYLDTFCDSNDCNITLAQWRYWRTKPGWQKPHIYQNGKLIVTGDK